MARIAPITCIDIGSSKIAVLVAVASGDGEGVHVVGAATTESTGIKKSQVVDIEDAIKAITESVEAAERMAGLSINQAFINIGGEHINCQNSVGVVAAAQPEGEIRDEDVRRVVEAARAVSLSSAEEIIHVLPRSYKVDSQEGIKDPVGMTGVRLETEAHLVTGSSTAIRNITKCVNELGISVRELVFSGLASSESVLTPTEKELGVILLDIGGGTTSIAVWIEGALAFSQVLPVGARNITNDLAIGMRQSLDVAEKVKRYLSRKPKEAALPNKKDRKNSEEKRGGKEDGIDLSKMGVNGEGLTYSRKTLVEGIIRPRLTEIFTMAGLELKESGFGGQTPAGVVLTGGGAKTVDIEAACKRTLSLPTRVGVPNKLTGLVDDIRDPAYAVSEGLILSALHSRDDGKKGLPPRIGRIIKGIPVKGAVNRVIEFFKQFLP